MATLNATYEKQKKDAFSRSASFSKEKKHWPKPEQFVGTYQDQWFGDVIIKEERNEFRITCQRSPRLKGELLPYSNNVFIIKWDDRSYDADAYIIFNYDENGQAQSALLKPISDVTDFSFDFSDLNLNRKGMK
ncbi:DUF3471 domain-containing protein [Sphingobacterium sp. HMA12]|uniref:DUF3471 domain-containing protein n=1 Tax=Sphingobacterium sp. HMA12 TaxID=2050894 RepID=UPI001F353B8A|nr:DUF3471 domain-containing protein [Sphingobacterium sp. HMA12]